MITMTATSIVIQCGNLSEYNKVLETITADTRVQNLVNDEGLLRFTFDITTDLGEIVEE